MQFQLECLALYLKYILFYFLGHDTDLAQERRSSRLAIGRINFFVKSKSFLLCKALDLLLVQDR